MSRPAEFRKAALLATTLNGGPYLSAWCSAALLVNPKVPHYFTTSDFGMPAAAYEHLIDQTLAYGVSHLKDPKKMYTAAQYLSKALDGK
jgi:hypothetical protein